MNWLSWPPYISGLTICCTGFNNRGGPWHMHSSHTTDPAILPWLEIWVQQSSRGLYKETSSKMTPDLTHVFANQCGFQLTSPSTQSCIGGCRHLLSPFPSYISYSNQSMLKPSLTQLGHHTYQQELQPSWRDSLLPHQHHPQPQFLHMPVYATDSSSSFCIPFSFLTQQLHVQDLWLGMGLIGG